MIDINKLINHKDNILDLLSHQKHELKAELIMFIQSQLKQADNTVKLNIDEFSNYSIKLSKDLDRLLNSKKTQNA
jgi:hypothetical protein